MRRDAITRDRPGGPRAPRGTAGKLAGRGNHEKDEARGGCRLRRDSLVARRIRRLYEGSLEGNLGRGSNSFEPVHHQTPWRADFSGPDHGRSGSGLRLSVSPESGLSLRRPRLPESRHVQVLHGSLRYAGSSRSIDAGGMRRPAGSALRQGRRSHADRAGRLRPDGRIFLNFNPATTRHFRFMPDEVAHFLRGLPGGQLTPSKERFTLVRA